MRKTFGSLTANFMLAATIGAASISLSAEEAQANASAVIVISKVKDRNALDDYIAAPTKQNQDIILDRDLVTPLQLAYTATCAAKVNPNAVGEDDVNSSMRYAFERCIEDTQNLHIAAAPNVDVAYTLGLSRNDDKYFTQCQSQSGVTAGSTDDTTQDQANKMFRCMDDAYWKDTGNPLTITIAGALGGTALIGGVIAYRRRQQPRR
jgi:hypothetical protein